MTHTLCCLGYSGVALAFLVDRITFDPVLRALLSRLQNSGRSDMLSGCFVHGGTANIKLISIDGNDNETLFFPLLVYRILYIPRGAPLRDLSSS